MNGGVIDSLKRRIYKKGEIFKERKGRSLLPPRQNQSKTYWGSPRFGEAGETDNKEDSVDLTLFKKPSTSSYMKFLIIGIIAIVLVGIGAAVFVFKGGINIISSSNIEINLEGPTSLKGGELGNWQLQIVNNNKIDLDSANLVIEYPENSKPDSIKESIGSLSGASKNPYERRSLGYIKAGESVNQTIGAYLFGEKDSDKSFKFTVEYRPKGSNAILAKSQGYVVRLQQSPVEIALSLPKEANAGESIELNADVLSNSDAVIRNLTLKFDYPNGFQYQSSDLKPAEGDNIWRFGDLASNAKRTVKIKGLLDGQDSTDLVFRATAGPTDDGGEIIIYGFSSQSIALKKPFLSLGLKVNNKTGDIVASKGSELNVVIKWQNTLSAKINNAAMEVKLNGLAVDERSIKVNKGAYRSFDKTLIWNQSTFPELGSIEPMQEGEASFSFSILNPLPESVIKQGNATVLLEAEMKGNEITEDRGSVEIKNHLSDEIKIATVLQLSRKALYYSGPFKNSGPLPPKVDKETTYTVVWSLANSTNEVSDVSINAFLPAYIRWLGVISPNDAAVSYNQATGEIIWKPGNIRSGVGFSEPAKILSFQISLLPSANQIDSRPVLSSETVLTAKDNFTGLFLRDVKSAITTYLDSDPQFKYNEAAVAQ